MHDPAFTVVITTYNRADLLTRALQSVRNQNRPNTEIVVVDDASTDRTQELVSHAFPEVRYLRQSTNRGPGEARNRGIQEASFPWVIVMDDDDTLLEGGLDRITRCIKNIDSEAYPVLQFATSDGTAPSPFTIIRLEDYLRSLLRGDFTPVIRKKMFLAESYRYPETRMGGENILWWKIAAKHGIPTWTEQVVKVGHDAPQRLTSTSHQIANAKEYARLQEDTIDTFREVMANSAPGLLLRKRLGAATYWLLAGERTSARLHVKAAWADGFIVGALLFGSLSLLPLPIIRRLFLLYRRLTQS